MIRKTISNKKGQAVIESVLIMVILIGLSVTLFTAIKEKGWMNDLVGEPSKYLKGMAETGLWEKNPSYAEHHPNAKERRIMNKGIEAI